MGFEQGVQERLWFSRATLNPKPRGLEFEVFRPLGKSSGSGFSDYRNA